MNDNDYYINIATMDYPLRKGMSALKRMNALTQSKHCYYAANNGCIGTL